MTIIPEKVERLGKIGEYIYNSFRQQNYDYVMIFTPYKDDSIPDIHVIHRFQWEEYLTSELPNLNSYGYEFESMEGDDYKFKFLYHVSETSLEDYAIIARNAKFIEDSLDTGDEKHFPKLYRNFILGMSYGDSMMSYCAAYRSQLDGKDKDGV